MARIVLATLLLFFAVVGCAQRPIVRSIPAPNFNGPMIAQRESAPKAKPAPAPPVARSTGPRSWMPQVPARPWKWIVIHHSATTSGSAAVFDRMHRDLGWDELGYHFVIGNGTNSSDGQVEVGSRWPKQKWGAHAKTPDNRYNDYGIGVCLVGNFDLDQPTPRQMQSLAQLVGHLQKTYRIPAGQIVGHGDTRATHCPGRLMNLAQVRRSAQTYADADANAPASETLAAGQELLTDLQSE